MSPRRTPHADPASRPILPWRFVAGAFLHFLAPAYLCVTLIAVLLRAPAGASWERLLDDALAFSGPFLLGYAGLTVLACAAAAIAEPILQRRRARRLLRDPAYVASQSHQRLAAAIAQARALLGPEASAQMDSLQTASWRHDDPRYRALAGDFADMIRTAAAARDSAPGDDRHKIITDANVAVQHITEALDRLLAAESGRKQSDAKTAARYIELRYGSSDFSGESS
ncbi:MAG: hypothetical protein J7494_03165 [Sphingobium sp.]|nr:hypothetical protein [Sphingobium sp.]